METHTVEKSSYQLSSFDEVSEIVVPANVIENANHYKHNNCVNTDKHGVKVNADNIT